MTLCSICSNKCILHYCLSSKICSPYPVCTTILNSRTFHPLLFYVKWEIIVLCDLMLQNTLYRNYSSKSVLSFISFFIFRVPAWGGEAQIAGHTLESVSFLFVLPLFWSGLYAAFPLERPGIISSGAWKTEFWALFHLFAPKVWQTGTFFSVASMINRICISITEDHSRRKQNIMKIVWSCVIRWLFVNWNENNEMQEMRECLPQTWPRVAAVISSKLSTGWMPLWAFFFFFWVSSLPH